MPFPRFLFFLLLFTQFSAAAQQAPPDSRIELLPGARELIGGEFNGVKIRKIIGNVSFRQGDAFLYCDSAYQYLDRSEVDAFSNVRVVQNDTVTITGDRGHYEGSTRTARMTGNVVMRDPRMTLTTDALDYNLAAKTAAYTTGGHLTDPKNTLDSKEGYYDTSSKVFVFKQNVHLITPDSELNNDTLRYNTATKIAYFNGPTRIKGKQGNLYAEKGTYNTATRVSNFERNAKIDTPNYLLGGDRLIYDEIKLYGFANGHVSLISKKDNLTLRGDVGRYWRALGRTKLYGGRPVIRNISGPDTLYMAADTLLSVENRPGKAALRPVLYAWPHTQIFRRDLQGRCDSLTYDRQDSIIYLNRDPVLWQGHNQLTADSMQVRQKRGKIDQMRLYANSFIIGEDTLHNYNQVKGRNMVAYFRDSKIGRVDVLGNAESLYYALDNDTATTGLNKAIAASMTMRFAANKLKTISFLKAPEARFIPPHEFTPADQRLKNFRWRPTERPTRRQVLGKQFNDQPVRKTAKRKLLKARKQTSKKKPLSRPAALKMAKAQPGNLATRPATGAAPKAAVAPQLSPARRR